KALRPSWKEPREFTLVRDVIRVVSVEERLFDKKYAYVKIKNFQDRTDSYLKKALEGMRARSGGQLAGLVLDLRHNPGGLLDQAVKVADRFMADGVIVTTKGRGSRPDVWVNAIASAEDAQREQNLPGQFTGEDVAVAAQPVRAVATAPTPRPAEPDDPPDDTQLKTALDTLRTWQIFKNTLPGQPPPAKAASAHP